MTYLEAILLGAVQGIFMFVPVSSTAHLVVTQHMLIRGGSELPAPDSPEMILFDLVVHVGTLVSIVVVFHRSLWYLAWATLRDADAFLRRHVFKHRLGLHLRLVLLGMLTVLVTGILGLIFKSAFERVFGAPHLIAFTLAATGLLLWWTDRLAPRRGLKDIGPGFAVVIGVAQALALVPGLSRSGLTIIAGLFLGLKRRWAAEYSFLVAIPTILAATLFQSREVLTGAGLGGVGIGPLVVAFVVAALVGTIALKLVLTLLFRAQLKVFSFYLWALAIIVGLGFLDELL